MDNEAAINANYSLDMILLPPIRIRNGKILKSEMSSQPRSISVGNFQNYYVGNLPFTTTEDELKAVFGEFGSVRKVQIIMDRDTGRSRGFAFVEFAPFQDEGFDGLNELELSGRRLSVSIAKPRELR